ncbi:MAG: redoxin domain-containing protein [Bryobacterales bacterium]|nr:redoxin domain-containing protein [Bryobacterales bacterium]
MEQSRPLLEKSGVRIAAISYDSEETLRHFADKYGIGFPLLSDAGSAVICKFGILNTNIAPGLRAHGVPHPVEYFVTGDGVVIHKYFVPNYQHRITGSGIALREFGVVDEHAPVVRLASGAVKIEVGLSSAKAFAGQEISFFTKFEIDPGWHVYGAPLPESYTTTSVTFDDSKVIRQSFTLPPAKPKEIPVLRERLFVYEGAFEAMGSLLLKFPLDSGITVLSGNVQFQQCSATKCEPPERLPFELSLTLEPFMAATH